MPFYTIAVLFGFDGADSPLLVKLLVRTFPVIHFRKFGWKQEREYFVDHDLSYTRPKRRAAASALASSSAAAC